MCHFRCGVHVTSVRIVSFNLSLFFQFEVKSKKWQTKRANTTSLLVLSSQCHFSSSLFRCWTWRILSVNGIMCPQVQTIIVCLNFVDHRFLEPHSVLQGRCNEREVCIHHRGLWHVWGVLWEQVTHGWVMCVILQSQAAHRCNIYKIISKHTLEQCHYFYVTNRRFVSIQIRTDQSVRLYNKHFAPLCSDMKCVMTFNSWSWIGYQWVLKYLIWFHGMNLLETGA